MVNSITCPNCNTTIYSRSRHDYRTCRCKKYAIDGGDKYIKLCFPSGVPVPKIKRLRVYATRQQLYIDWNYRYNKFGIVHRHT